MLQNKLGLMAAILLRNVCSQAGSVLGKAPTDLAMPDEVELIFNHNARSHYRSPLTRDWRIGDDMEEWLIDAIDGSNKEVLVAFKSSVFRGLRIAQALIAAQQRGVHVAVVLENNYRQAWSKLRPSRLNRRSK